ncbi:MAG: hypothetical protein MUC43_04750 [Pirellula sp.]|jgi:hypothetical protein|nr:hypothetical protein [Pirellula sp.]
MTNQQHELVIDDLEQARLYAWNDPILDRATFEDRLPKEPHLAELVAQAVGEYLEIQAACSAMSQANTTALATSTLETHHASRYMVNAAWALSIAVAVVFLVIPSQWNAETKTNLSLSSLAQTWSELHHQPTSYNPSEPIDSPMDSAEYYGDASVLMSDDSDGDLPDLPEWLLAATSSQTTDTGAMP